MKDTELSGLEQMVKVSLTQKEREEIGALLDFLDQDLNVLHAVDTEEVEPLIYGFEMQNIFREDIALKEIPREIILSGAPEARDGYFEVPKTVE